MRGPKEDRPVPRWREDFPIEWERDHYVTRRELAKFLTLGSALLAAASAVIAVAGRFRRAPATKALPIARSDDLPPNGSVLFRYPTAEDPCILLRTASGELKAYSQVCTHLSCAVVYQPSKESLFCPCHWGSFSCAEGRPTAGPPTRPLPRIRLEERGGRIFAVGVEV
jgi:arsenite oxidase small subunit